MAELRFEASQDGQQVQIQIFELDQPSMSVDFLKNQFNLTEYRSYFLMEDALTKALKLFKNHQAAVTQNPELDGEPVEVVVAEKKDAMTMIEVSDDKMSCSLVVESAYGSPNPDIDQLKSLLSENGVVKGIDEAKLKAMANQLSNISSGTMLKETVAKGKPPGQSKQAKIELLIQPLQDRLMKPQLRGDGTVDMHDFGEIEMVEPGDSLARRIPPVVGEPGYNVLGEEVHAAKPEDRELGLGDGAEISANDKNLLIASRKGVPLKIPSGVEVSEAYCVNDVDLKTGNIDFDGTVVVQGSVREGMEVKATKKIMIRDYVESAKVVAGLDLVIGKGVLGHKTDGDQYSASIECGGDFFANYVQYAKVVVANQCTVTKHVLHSQVQATVIELESPKKTEAKIIGGLIQPQQKLICNTLGAPSYITTKIDFSTRFSDQLAELAQANDELNERLNVVRGMKVALRSIEDKSGCASSSDQVTKISNTIHHFQEIIKELKEKRKSLSDQISEISSGLEICVKRTLYPGVEVQFVDKFIPIKQEKPNCKVMIQDKGLVFFTLN